MPKEAPFAENWDAYSLPAINITLLDLQADLQSHPYSREREDGVYQRGVAVSLNWIHIAQIVAMILQDRKM